MFLQAVKPKDCIYDGAIPNILFRIDSKNDDSISVQKTAKFLLFLTMVTVEVGGCGGLIFFCV